MSPNRQASIPGSGSDREVKRKPVRRDPEKRRQQNVQAQKKYREKLRGRLSRLELLAASVVQNPAMERTPATGSLDSCTSHGSPATPNSQVTSFFSIVTPAERYFPIPQESCDLLSPGIWDPTTHVNPSFLMPCHDTGHDGGAYWTVVVDCCGCASPHIQMRTQSPDPSNYGVIRIHSFGPSRPTPRATVPDLQANTLRMDTVCIVAAFYSLSQHVGLTEETICTDSTASPFYRPSAAESTDDTAKAHMINTVQKLYSTLKPDLRPTEEQITVEHDPYIDMLPFPTLRRNLIVHRDAIDRDAFLLELTNGLVCWGGAGVGSKDRVQDTTGHVSTGTPWDVRSWEAKDWFLKKYWALLGGEDGELVRQTEWWRSMRGEGM